VCDGRPNSHPLEVLTDADREARCAAALALVLVDNMQVIELSGASHPLHRQSAVCVRRLKSLPLPCLLPALGLRYALRNAHCIFLGVVHQSKLRLDAPYEC
jgi:hypothetical protein